MSHREVAVTLVVVTMIASGLTTLYLVKRENSKAGVTSFRSYVYSEPTEVPATIDPKWTSTSTTARFIPITDPTSVGIMRKLKNSDFTLDAHVPTPCGMTACPPGEVGLYAVIKATGERINLTKTVLEPFDGEYDENYIGRTALANGIICLSIQGKDLVGRAYGLDINRGGMWVYYESYAWPAQGARGAVVSTDNRYFYYIASNDRPVTVHLMQTDLVTQTTKTFEVSITQDKDYGVKYDAPNGFFDFMELSKDGKTMWFNADQVIYEAVNNRSDFFRLVKLDLSSGQVNVIKVGDIPIDQRPKIATLFR